MGLIPQETIEEIIEKVEIADWIEQYVPLKPAGGLLKGLCPFHDEKTASFVVTPSRQTFKCFGCQEGGTVIGFVMKYEGLSFPDAVRRLAEQAGITIVEEAFDPKQEARRRKRNAILTLQGAAAEFFHLQLLKKPYAQVARDYLNSRQFDQRIAKEWKLGYAPENQRIFFDWAQKAGYAVETLVAGGLAAWRDEANPARGAYARFRHRLMFPVFDENSNVIAFSGRVLASEQRGGKYVNSPETAVFYKSKTFFGFHKTRRPITKAGHAIICEGQIDLISAFDAGVENIVAPLGTALTEDHAKILRRQAEEVTLCFDSDEAGLNAAGKAFRALAPKGMMVRLAMLPEGEDPDSFLKKQGLEAFQKIIASAPEYFDFHIDRKGSRFSSGPLRDRLAFARELAADIALVDDKMLQDSLINRITVKLGVGEEEIRKQIAGAAKVQRRARRNRTLREAREKEKRGESPIQAAVIENRSIRLLCRLLLTEPEIKARYREEAVPDFFRELPESELLGKVWGGKFDPSRSASVHAFCATLSETEQAALQSILDDSIPEAAAEWAEECLITLEKQALQNKIAVVKTRLGAQNLSAVEANQLTQELLTLQSRRSTI